MLSKELSITKERYRGYLDALQAAGLSPTPSLQVTCAHDEEKNIEAIRAMLTSEDRRMVCFRQ